MEYSKLVLLLCLIVALTKAIPLPPDVNTFLEETGALDAQNEVEEPVPTVKEVVAPNYEEEKEEPAAEAEVEDAPENVEQNEEEQIGEEPIEGVEEQPIGEEPVDGTVEEQPA